MKRARYAVFFFLTSCIPFSACTTDPGLYATHFFDEGVVWYQKGQYDQSVDAFSNSLKMNSEGRETYVVYYNRGLAHFRNNDYNKAIDDFTISIQLTPGERPEQRGSGMVYDASVVIRPPSPKVKYELFNVFKARGDVWFFKKAYQRAIDDYEVALNYGEQRKELPSLYDSLGWARFEMGDAKGAIADFSLALSREPKLAQSYFGRAKALFEAGDTDAALRDARKACELKPENQEYHDRVVELQSLKE